MLIESVDDILYVNGLCFTSTQPIPKRKLFYNPYIGFAFIALHFLRELVILSINGENDLMLKIFGSFGHMLGIREHMTKCFLLADLVILSSKLIYYYNYKKGVKPTFLRLFQMISGSEKTGGEDQVYC